MKKTLTFALIAVLVIIAIIAIILLQIEPNESTPLVNTNIRLISLKI